MLDALAEHFPPQAEWTRPARRPVHLGDAARLHRHHRPAGARAARERRVRARRGGVPRRPRAQLDAAQLLRPATRTRSARASAASARSSTEQVELYGTLTGEPSRARAASATRPRGRAGDRRRACVPLPRASDARRRRAGRREPRRGAQGRPLAGAPGVAALGRARRGRARAARPRGGARSTSAPTWCERLRDAGPTSPSSRCTAATARTARCRSCSRSLGIPYTGSGVLGLHRARWTRC